jgi:hypothetical protein
MKFVKRSLANNPCFDEDSKEGTTSVSKELHDMKLCSKVSDLKQNATNTALSLQGTQTNDSIESESIADSLQGHYDHILLNR